METSEGLVVSNQKQLSIFDMKPKGMVIFASEMAGALKDIIEKQQLYSLIQGKKYIRVEGWQTLGSLLGILPREEYVKELEDGSYEAKVNLIKQSDGSLIGGASAICGVDETRWKSADKYARRSMAVTRATGKSYRISFSWIMSLAGYEVTPAEEMPETTTESYYIASPKQKIELAALCKEFGITDKETIRGFSNSYQGKVLMSSLRDAIAQQVSA